MTLLAIFAALAALALIAGSKREEAAPVESQVRGKSGLVWGVKTILHDGESRLVEVINRDGRTGRDPAPVLRYVEQASDPNARYLATLGENTTAGLVRSAMADFGVKGPVFTGDVLPPNPSPMVPAGKIRVDKGAYQGNVVVSFPASIITSASLLQSKITEKGFTNVRVTTDKPKSWFTSEDADYYVSATWPEHEPEIFDRPKALTSYRKL